MRSWLRTTSAVSSPVGLRLHGSVRRGRSLDWLRPFHPLAERRFPPFGELLAFEKKSRQQNQGPDCEIPAVGGNHVLADHGEAPEEFILRLLLIRRSGSFHRVGLSH